MTEAVCDAPGAWTDDRRRHPRLPVTLSARVHHGERCYRATILDVGDGGLLLAPIAALPVVEAQTIHVEAPPIGRVRARIVGVSRLGIHARVEETPRRYRDAVRRLSDLTQVWTVNRP